MPSRFQEMLKQQRENSETSRAGLKWEADEDGQMLSMLKQGKSIDDIAKILYRTPGSIKTRLIITAVNKMNDEGVSLSDAANSVCVESSEVTEFLNRKAQRDSKKQERLNRPKVRNTSDSYQNILRRLDVLEKAVFK